MNVLIVGNGQMGQAVARVGSFRGHKSSFFTSRDERSQFLARAAENDVVCIAISTHDTGEAALGYILDAMRAGKPVALCEKGSLAYHFDEIRPYLGRIGYTAAAGGASGMLSLFSFPHLGLERIIGIVNGSLNFEFSECARNKDPYQVYSYIQRLGLCEPEKGSSLSGFVNGEVRDIVLKASIIFNRSGISDETLSASEFGEICLFEDEVLRQLARKSMRFVVSIAKKPNPAIDDHLYDCLRVRKGEWHIEIGLAHMSLLPFCPFPERQQNALVIEDYAGSTQITGIGAGPIPTAATMIMDAQNLV
jgi:homoserine dehydrogenase